MVWSMCIIGVESVWNWCGIGVEMVWNWCGLFFWIVRSNFAMRKSKFFFKISKFESCFSWISCLFVVWTWCGPGVEVVWKWCGPNKWENCRKSPQIIKRRDNFRLEKKRTGPRNLPRRAPILLSQRPISGSESRRLLLSLADPHEE